MTKFGDSMRSNELHPDEVSSVIAAIYDASAGISSWEKALDSIADITGSDAAALCPIPDRAIEPPFAIRSGSVPDLDTEKERDNASPDALVRKDGASMSTLRSDVGNGLTLTLTRVDSDQSYGIAQRDLFNAICVHVRRAMSLASDCESVLRDAGNGATLISRLALGVVFLSFEGRVIRSNAFADALIGRECWLIRRSDRLFTVDRTLTAVFSRLAAAPATGTATDEHPASLLLTASEAGILKVTAASLSAAGRRAPGGRISHALFLAPASDRETAADLLMSGAYGLSPAETRVFTAAARGIGAPEVAVELGISVATVRSHLKRVFVKTGTKNQSDLIRFVAGWAASDLYKGGIYARS
jgi:DNA-binding CsgD family transcriptional regulator